MPAYSWSSTKEKQTAERGEQFTFARPGGLLLPVTGQKKPAHTGGWSGDVLFSRGAAPKVSSELKGLTTVFGMGTGVSLSL